MWKKIGGKDRPMKQITLFNEEELTGLQDDAPEELRSIWKKAKQDMRKNFTVLQELPYEAKLKRQRDVAYEFFEEMEKRGACCHVSVGGLDSITLLVWLRSIGIDVKGVSVSGVEDKSIQEVHKALGVEILHSYKNKAEVLNELGFPVISKKTAGKIDMLQNPSENNRTVRHAIITGECGEKGHFAKKSRMQLPKKWLELFAGMANEEYGTDYKTAPFKVSNACCYWLKEKPCDDWAKANNSYPYLGLMASEGGQREEALIEHGCNYYGATVTRSAPFAIFMRQDILRLALEMDEWYKLHADVFEKEYHNREYGKGKEYVAAGSIIPKIYGEIKRYENGMLYTTKAQRTGCSMCGFGIHLEDRPHRFDRLRERNYAEWEFWMYRCCTDEKTGEKYGWGRVLDWIGVAWEDVPGEQLELDFE